ncbi:amidohydrolase [Georgenia sp. Z1491]|uniref:amidohydrolase n=1 Tax=Georgenia sp. Z1491 TaxID=3416707 RepID=UPI003CF93DC8
MSRTVADLVLTGGLVTTMAEDGTGVPAEAEALAIVGDRIAAVGTADEIDGWTGPDTRIVDLAGRRVVPGLIDTHVHFARAGFTWNDEVRWGTVTSLAEGLALIAERARSTPAGTWIMVIGGWDPAQFSERRHPTRDELDEAAPEHPVMIQHLYSYGMLNSAALARVPLARAIDEGIDPATVETDDAGTPTGLVRTMTALRWLYAQLPVPSLEEQVASTAAAGRELATFGVVGLIDGGGANTGPDVYRPLFETWRRGELVPRVRLTVHSSGPGREEEDLDGITRFVHPRQGDERLSVLGVGEIMMWPMHDGVDRLPDLAQEHRDRIEAILRSCAERGWTVQMHLFRPETTDVVVDMWRRIHADIPLSDLRWTIVHGESVTAEHAEVLASMSAGVICEAILRMEGEHIAELWGADAVRAAPDVRALQAAGVRIAAGSDGMRVATYNPFATLQWLTTGRSLSGTQIWDESVVLDRHEALALLTTQSAWFSFEEGSRGRLQPGFLADVAVLDQDYLEVDASELPAIRADLTVIGGQVVHDASAQAR